MYLSFRLRAPSTIRADTILTGDGGIRRQSYFLSSGVWDAMTDVTDVSDGRHKKMVQGSGFGVPGWVVVISFWFLVYGLRLISDSV